MKTNPYAYVVKVEDFDGNVVATFSVEVDSPGVVGSIRNAYGEEIGDRVALGEDVVEAIESDTSVDQVFDEPELIAAFVGPDPRFPDVPF